MANYVYLQTYNDKSVYHMYGGEPNNMAFTTTEQEAKHFFKENYIRMEIHQLQLPKQKKTSSKKR